MALENYRPIQFPEKTELDSTDVVLIDSATNGTNKYQLNRIAAQASAETAAAVAAEAQARQAADAAEVTARNAAISAAISDEVTARNAAIAANVDDTLTVSGKSADAKKTGDEIADLKSDLNALNYVLKSMDDLNGTVTLYVENDSVVYTWQAVFEAENDGTYSSKYRIGDTLPLDLGTEGIHQMEIVAFDTDDLDGGGKAKITWISKDLLATTHVMNTSASTSGGWSSSNMRSWLKNTIKPLIPAEVRNNIKNVTKISSIYSSAVVVNGQTTVDDVWIPSNHEVFPDVDTFESQGASYPLVFTDNDSRIKKVSGVTDSNWHLRSVNDGSKFRCVYIAGGSGSKPANEVHGVALGFCT